ncbi:MAG: SpoIIE family protein phosphatase, partial [Acidimicrobiales bacterium]
MAAPRSDGAIPTDTDPAVLLEARTAGRLLDLTTALVSELDLERLVQLVTDASTELIGAEYGAFFHGAADDSSVLLHAVAGPVRDALEGLPSPRTTPLLQPTFLGAEVVRLADATQDPRYAANPPFNGTPPASPSVRSYLAFPVVSRAGDPLGALFFGHSRPGVFTEQHERLLAAFATPAAIAIENARLFLNAERDRQDALRLAERVAHMHAVSARLAGARTVDEVAGVIVTGAAYAMGCVRASLFVLADGGTNLRLLDSFGYEGEFLERWGRIDTRERVPTTDALRERRLVLLQSDEEWRAQYPEHAGTPAHSVALAVIPLALGPHVFGVAGFGWDGPRPFSDDDARFLEAVADQCAQALERARLYEVEREAARTLQQSLLPPRTPEIPGMEVAAVYRPGDRSVAVGGDFYDVFPTGPNRWGVAMGDVCGRGARAASRTALVRYTLRAVATGEDDVLAVLRRLNDAMLAEPDADDRFCATVFGVVELDAGGASVTLACAGHPLPVVVRRAGWLDVRGQPGTLVGVLDELDVSVDRVGLGPGDALVLFTDGIAEARNNEGEQFADEYLAEALLEATDRSATELAGAIRDQALAFAGGTLGDDFAVLVLRVPPDAADDPRGRLASALGPDAAA